MAYPQYYLDMKFFLDRRSVNALQGFVRELIDGKSAQEAIQDTLGMDLSILSEKNVRQYTDAILPAGVRPRPLPHRAVP